MKTNVEEATELVLWFYSLMNGDTDLQVACLDFLGYLALGDMVKIRDCISEVALCLNSDKDVIRGS